jgi:S-adenosylmethionine:tRNA ribosyltransferase-isomerase
MLVSDFDFDLPPELIAQEPANPRDSARLLHVQASEAFADRTVTDLPNLLRPTDLLVVNDTRVIPARLTGHKQRPVRGQNSDQMGAKIEATLHKANGANIWRAFARPAKKLKVGDTITYCDDFSAVVSDKFDGGEVVLSFNKSGNELMDAIREHGIMPLPPYIKRGSDGRDSDIEDYQTLFAARDGAVAAPTASLHFTPGLLKAIEDCGVKTARLTLHVGAGTFLPVKAEDTDDHQMHAEWGEMTPETAELINQTKQAGGRIIAAGTTALRLLESAADEDGIIQPFCGETDIFITPGYRFRVVEVLLSNFHLPKSTLFMLVSAFAGLDRMQAAYAHARANKYRFYSYGDATLLERAE